MVICKYYRQGNCRYGQYCQFEHINHFGNTKGEDDIIILVAKEVLLAERGGQWLLSCFAPLKERCCIPGMKDVSPEEVRWEIYEAQKNGMVEQAKLHFQQLCQEMKAKREMLKNPTRETITFLKKNLGSKCPGTQQFASPGNVFASAFGVQNNNPFAGNGFVSSSNASIFGKSNNNTTSVFGGGATFGNNLGGFNGAATSGAGSMFGTTSTSTSFSGVQNSAPAFGTPQSNSIFGGSSQNMFGQNNNVFGGTSQLSNASTTSLFNNSITSQANTSLFGGATTASNLFGGSSTGLQTNSVFGGVSTTSSSGSFNNGMFTQPKTQIPAFGGAPVFGGVTPNYNSNSTGNTIFGGGGQTFGAPAISSSGSIFGGSTAAATPAFGAVVSTTTPTFGTSVVASTAPGFAATTAPTFDLAQQPSNNTTFGVTASTPNVFATQNTNTMLMGNTPFGAPPVAMNGPFVTANSQQFDSTSTSSAPFSGTGFGVPVANTSNTFGTTETSSSNSIFANAATTFATTNGTVSNQSLFSASTFGNVNPVSSPFGSGAATTFTATTTLTSPFAPRTQQGSSPFGNVQNQPNINASPFRKSSCNEIVIDDSVYSAEGTLTDEEKNQFLADSFILGKIPLKPPTKALS
ncbi:nucleoporin NSP1 [Solenopsis invicta]|uniref:nucleoporin NSP1 n=1 Tax=Solenopsis invicta TaxID=13686 RepID=UPI0005960E7B|nr:nucleoporin NSP1 [Solenopsis invicta]